jgi:hypothetical protein
VKAAGAPERKECIPARIAPSSHRHQAYAGRDIVHGYFEYAIGSPLD